MQTKKLPFITLLAITFFYNAILNGMDKNVRKEYLLQVSTTLDFFKNFNGDNIDTFYANPGKLDCVFRTLDYLEENPKSCDETILKNTITDGYKKILCCSKLMYSDSILHINYYNPPSMEKVEFVVDTFFKKSRKLLGIKNELHELDISLVNRYDAEFEKLAKQISPKLTNASTLAREVRKITHHVREVSEKTALLMKVRFYKAIMEQSGINYKQMLMKKSLAPLFPSKPKPSAPSLQNSDVSQKILQECADDLYKLRYSFAQTLNLRHLLNNPCGKTIEKERENALLALTIGFSLLETEKNIPAEQAKKMLHATQLLFSAMILKLPGVNNPLAYQAEQAFESIRQKLKQ